MSHQTKCNPPPDPSPSTGAPAAGSPPEHWEHWEQWPTFRAAFLRFFPPAAAADTAFAAHFLHGIAGERRTASLDAAEARLAERAEGWSARAAALAAEIESALPPRPGEAVPGA
jgi:hypothetical protein